MANAFILLNASPSHQPRSSTPAVVPQLEVTEQQPPLTYFPWAQPLSALPAPTLQYQPASSTLPTPQFVPLPISIPEPAPQELEDARRVIGTLPIEKLLLEDEDNDTYVLNHASPWLPIADNCDQTNTQTAAVLVSASKQCSQPTFGPRRSSLACLNVQN